MKKAKQKQHSKEKSQRRQSRLFRKERLPEPVLRFSPTAWAKLLYFRDRQGTEIGGFGITRADDLLFVEEFVTVKQDVSVASVAFDDNAVADFFDVQVDAGRKPEQFARAWLHTHPGDSPHPSGTDEETFARVFGSCEWALMFILARNGKSYARLRFNTGPGGQVAIPVDVDFSPPFPASDHQAWEAEYKAHIKAESWPEMKVFGSDLDEEPDLSDWSVPQEWIEELEAMEPEERRQVLAELSMSRDPLEEEEVFDEY